jgi:TM2 domain-containing membrane protein YozV
MSFFFPGLGQLYKGRIGRGILIFIGQVCMWLIGAILLFIPTLAYWIWNIYDAYKGPHASELKG